MIHLPQALIGLLGIATMAKGAGFGEIGQSIPDCGGLGRFERVLARLEEGDGLYRSSAPYFDHEDSDQTVTADTIQCLQLHGITQVISLNSQAHNPSIRHALEQHGIAYTALPVADYAAPTNEQLEDAWRSFLTHRTGTLVWCGYGHGRTGTIITALQMYVQADRQEVQTWDHLQYWHDNNVETEAQYAWLDEVHMRTLCDDENSVELAETPTEVDEATQQRARRGDFEGLDCAAVLGVALSYSIFPGSRMDKRWVPLPSKSCTLKHSLSGKYCSQAQEALLRQQCGVSDSSRPSPMLLTDGRVRVFAHNSKGNMTVIGWESGEWWDHWESRHGRISGEPAAMFMHAGDLRVYARQDSRLVESAFYGDEWHPWDDLGGSMIGTPSAIWLGGQNVRVYARSTANRLVEKAYYNGNWQAWKEIGGYIADDPSAVWLGAGEGIRIYARDKDGQLMEIAYKDQTWHRWTKLGGSMRGSPSAISLGANDVRVYARHGIGELIEYKGGSWHNLGGTIMGSPGAVYMGTHDGIRVYARNTQGNLLERGFWEGRWQDWNDLGRNECAGRG